MTWRRDFDGGLRPHLPAGDQFLYGGPYTYYGDMVSKRAVDAVFEGLFILTDLRAMLRETAPHHALSGNQREQVRVLLARLEGDISVIREDLDR